MGRLACGAICAIVLAAAVTLGACATPGPAVPEAQETDASETQEADAPEASREGEAEPSMATTTMTVNGNAFDVQLADNETARAFAAFLPAELSMDELNGNEKYCYLDAPLPTSAEAVGRIEAGDIMLYGDRCVVVFYGSHDTSYSYTRIGTVENPEGLAEAAGAGTVNIRFE